MSKSFSPVRWVIPACVRLIAPAAFVLAVLGLGWSQDGLASLRLDNGKPNPVDSRSDSIPPDAERESGGRDVAPPRIDRELAERQLNGRACSVALQGLVGAIESPATTNTYELWGTLILASPPASGDLYIRVEGGPSQVLSAPFPAQIDIEIEGLYADGSVRQVSASFTDDPACQDAVAFQTPVGAGLILDQGYLVPSLSVPGPFNSPGFAGTNVANNLFVAGSAFDTSAVRIPISIPDKGLTAYTSFCTELGESVALATYNNEFVVQPLEFAARGT